MARGAQCAQNGETIHVRQTDVEHEGRPILLVQQRECGRAISYRADLETVTLEALPNHLTDIRLVVHDKNTLHVSIIRRCNAGVIATLLWALTRREVAPYNGADAEKIVMPDSYLVIGAIVLNVLLLVGLIILGPRLLRRLDSRTSEEATRLREMLLDVLSEQEAVTIRQAQIGSSLSTMQGQIGKLAELEAPTFTLSPEALADAAGMPQLDRRLESLQGQLGSFLERSANEQREQQLKDSQSWSNLMGLLATMQDRITSLNLAVEQQPQANMAADRLLQELDNEMQNLRALSDEIAGLQWKLRRSVLERETSLAALRAQVLGAPKFGHRAA